MWIDFIGFSATTFQSTSDRYFSQTNQKSTKEISPCTCSNGNSLIHCTSNRAKRKTLYYDIKRSVGFTLASVNDI